MKDEPNKNPPVVPQVAGKCLKDIQDEEPIQSFIEAISPKKRSKSHISSSSKPTQSMVIETPSTQKSIQISKKEKISKQKNHNTTQAKYHDRCAKVVFTNKILI